MRRLRLNLVVTLVAIGACSGGDSESRAYLSEIRPPAVEINTAIFELQATLERDVGATTLYIEVTDLRIPNRIAVLRDRASRVEAPESMAFDHERYVAMLGELLLATEALDGAVADEDDVALSRAAISIDTTIARALVDLSTGMCDAVTPERFRFLCTDTSGYDDYDGGVHRLSRILVAELGPRLMPERGPLTDADREQLFPALNSEIEVVVGAAFDRLIALDPPPGDRAEYHRELRDYLLALLETAGGLDPAGPGFADATLDLTCETAGVLASLHPGSGEGLPLPTDVWFGTARCETA